MLSRQPAVLLWGQLWPGKVAPRQQQEAGQKSRSEVWWGDTERVSESLDVVQLEPEFTWLRPSQQSKQTSSGSTDFSSRVPTKQVDRETGKKTLRGHSIQTYGFLLANLTP